jgi:hypothetical protein
MRQEEAKDRICEKQAELKEPQRKLRSSRKTQRKWDIEARKERSPKVTWSKGSNKQKVPARWAHQINGGAPDSKPTGAGRETLSLGLKTDWV